MKREASIFLIVVLVVFGLLLYQFYPIMKKGPIQTKVLELPEFQELEVDIPYNVFLVEGEMNSLVVEGPEKAVSNIFYEFNDTILNISYKRSKWIREWLALVGMFEMEINVYITAKDISLIHVTNPEIYSNQRSYKDDLASRIIFASLIKPDVTYVELNKI